MRTFASTLPKVDQSEVLFDSHPEISLNFKHVQNALKKGYQRPFLLVDVISSDKKPDDLWLQCHEFIPTTPLKLILITAY